MDKIYLTKNKELKKKKYSQQSAKNKTENDLGGKFHTSSKT